MQHAPYDRLSALDASFLYAETEDAPLAVGLLAIFEGGGIDEPALRAHVASRLSLCPRLRKKLAFVPYDQGRPIWVDDGAFDLVHHVSVLSLAAPADDEAARDYMAAFMQLPLCRTRPLWQLRTFPMTEGRMGLTLKVHHCLLDGVSAAQLVLSLFDMRPSVPPRSVEAFVPAPAPSADELLAHSLEEQTGRFEHWLGQALSLGTDARNWKSAGTRFMRIATAVAEHGRGYFGSQPRAPLSHRVGRERSFTTLDIPLEALKRIKSEAQATINDLALTLVASGIARVMEARAHPCEEAIVKAAVPVSRRSAGEMTAFGNRVSMMLADLPVDSMPAQVRLSRIHGAMHGLKQSGQADGADVFTQLADDVPPLLVSFVARALTLQNRIDVIVTNVPGPPVPLYLLGQRLLAAHPCVPLFGSTPLGIAITSYAGKLRLGIHADKQGLPELAAFQEGVLGALAELLAALDTGYRREVAASVGT
jgi:WS/DGAT/MGAT family acyltransferase